MCILCALAYLISIWLYYHSSEYISYSTRSFRKSSRRRAAPTRGPQGLGGLGNRPSHRVRLSKYVGKWMKNRWISMKNDEKRWKSAHFFSRQGPEEAPERPPAREAVRSPRFSPILKPRGWSSTTPTALSPRRSRCSPPWGLGALQLPANRS